ncbi:hypothetical protein [Francisella sciaenopsi]|uniref:Uncharacterized protein n=1 Tax=Francisella sciaenopsi TaxID=3055034 RepID=A0ABQ6PD00_9GAMM
MNNTNPIEINVKYTITNDYIFETRIESLEGVVNVDDESRIKFLSDYKNITAKEFLISELEKVSSFVNDLNVKYNKKHAINYVFSAIFTESLMNIQPIIDIFKVKEVDVHLKKISESYYDQSFKEKTIAEIHRLFQQRYLAYFICAFIHHKDNVFSALKWQEYNTDIFPIDDIEFKNVEIIQHELEETCLGNHFLDKDNINNNTIAKVIYGYHTKVMCEKFQDNWGKNRFSREIFDYFDINISKFILKRSESSRPAKLTFSANPKPKKQFKNLEIRELRNIIFSLLLCYCNYAKVYINFYEADKLKKKLNDGKYEKGATTDIEVAKLEYVLEYLKSLKDGKDIQDKIFTFNSHDISGVTNPFATDNKDAIYDDRLPNSNIKSQNAFIQHSMGIAGNIELSITEYRKELSKLSIFQKYKTKKTSELYEEFYTESNKLQENKELLTEQLNDFWINQGHLYMLVVFVYDEIFNSMNVPSFISKLIDIKSKRRDRYLANITARFNYDYCRWLSYAADIYDL